MPKKIRLSFTKENRALVRAGLKTETRRRMYLPACPNGLGPEVEGILVGSVTGIVESLLGTPGVWDVQFWLDNPVTTKSPYGNPQTEPVDYWMPEPVQIMAMGTAAPWVEVRYLDSGEDSEPRYCEVSWETFAKILERKERYAAKGRDWREPINPRFMYRDLARTWLPGVRVWPERLGEMSILSAICEGISEQANLKTGEKRWGIHALNLWSSVSPIDAYRMVWESINGADSWKPEQWVWAVKFEPPKEQN